MIFSSVDFPDPLGPMTPILAPGRNDNQTLVRTSFPPGTVLVRPFMT
jgi:hypothetical protein